MQCLQWSLLFVLLASVQLGKSAPQQSGFFLLPRVPFNFPDPEGPQPEPKKNPEPRQFVVEQPAGELSQQELGQLLLLANGLSGGQPQASVQSRKLFHHLDKEKDKDKHHGHPTYNFIVLPTANVTNNVTQINEGTTATTTRTGEVLRTPIAYPVPYPMQYFRRRGDELGYPGVYGWNEASLYGGLAGSGLGGLAGLGGFGGLRGSFNNLAGGLNGGLNSGLNAGLSEGLNGGLAGVPLVPITLGNEVRYVPLNLRMFRQLVSLPVREKDDVMEEDDLTPFRAVNEEQEQEPEEAAPEEAEAGQAEANEASYVPLSQRRKQRRRGPLKAFTQKMRQVQFL